MLTISSWPRPQAGNQYMSLYYGALGRRGVSLGPAVEFSDAWLRAQAGRVDAIQIQWLPEEIWRVRGRSSWARVRGLAGLWKYLRLARSLGIRLLWTLHDVARHEGSDWVDEWGYRLLASSADLCIVHDQWAANQFVTRFRGARDRVCVMEHGNYDGVFPPARSRKETLAALGINESSTVLLCHGHIRPYKGYEVAIEAARRLGRPFHLIVAGAPVVPAYADELRAKAAGLSNVKLLFDHQTDQAVSDLFAAADCYVLPYTQITGSGALLTTATLGRGFVASDLPYFRQAVEHDPDAGVFFQTGSVDSLAEAIRAFFTKPPHTRHEAARHIADRVPWNRVVQPVVARLNQMFPNRLMVTDGK